MSSRPQVLPLDDVAACPPSLVGPKARNLALLRSGGVEVPGGFVLTADAWRAFRDRSGIAAPIARLLAGLDHPTPGALRDAARAIEKLHLDAPMPAELGGELARAYRELGDEAPVAVRSSAVEEDRASGSAAGLFRTSLDVRGARALERAVREGWASLFSEAALAYRLDRGAPLEGGGMAIVVQRMIAPDAAGVLFTRRPFPDPDRPAADAILIEAVPGRGRELVDGEADPERWEVPRDGPAVVSPSPAEVRRALLSPDQVDALARAARRVEELLGPAVDVEWALSEGRLLILQARPITTFAPREAIRWTAANTQEALEDPVTPLTWSLFAPLIEHGRADVFRLAGLRDVEGPGYMRLFHGRPYFNVEWFRSVLRQVPGWPENVFDALIFGEGQVAIAFRPAEFDRRTLRWIGLLLAARFAARERFELFLKVFDVRLARLQAVRPEESSDQGLLDLRARATELLEGALRRHVLGTAIAGAGYLLLDFFLRKTGMEGTVGEGLVAKLTAGAPGNVLARASEELDLLVRAGGDDPSVREALLADDPLDRLERLARSGHSPAREFRDGLRRFLERHGHRAEREAELLAPRWIEDPAPILAVIRSYLTTGRREPPRAREARLARAARSLAKTIAARLGKRGLLEHVLPARRGLFWLLYREARRYAPYRENLKATALEALLVVKRAFLEQGGRLVARGALEHAEDVFFLEVRELDLAFAGKADPGTLHSLVRARRGDRERQLGTEPPRLVVEGAPTPRAERQEAPPSAVLRGVPSGAGKVRARARILRSMADATRLGQGEILVARVVNAAWTPLFAIAGGIVAEVGGVLSHGAIIAREYGLPSVFGVAGATTRIHDGQLVEIDGERGTVTLTDPPP